ncbi:myosin-G heavy chain isoform X2 [Sitodiplosis mosellana]|uniref:myosin-G heavy chain isoform X2 n=1 Tax=Sitodiplosis mosellana TaxID=263140 RepID=UPI002443A977|nr:myosin-G heavy chain isoform X2 [Sitodiplosis mosellana]XP_055305456.1 myosin-G heavy chain isoform X2 [Sitodiplosis mosellana]
MTDEHGMLRNGSIDSVGTAGRELNFDSTASSSSTVTTTTNSVNTTLPNNDGNNNENSTAAQNNSDRQPQSQSHSPIDTQNGNNNADNFVSTSNGNYSSGSGNGSNANSKQPNHSVNYSNSNNGSPLNNVCGGRLQFFKDGKFILELARSKEGDRGWISVPRKTYWPPAALSQNNLNNHKNESSTSLSFSDDNSSIQSSPWQRDHSWKQLSPRKNISKDLNLYYYRPAALALSEASKLVSKYVRRQPHSRRNHSTVRYAKCSVQKPSLLKVKEEKIDIDIDEKNKIDDSNERNDKGQDMGDTVDSSNGKAENKLNSDDDKMSHKDSDGINSKFKGSIAAEDIKIENSSKSDEATHLRNCRKRQTVRSSSNLSGVIEKLIARVSEKPVNVTSTQTGLGIQFSASSRSNELFFPHQHVSPRKRILREFEKVSLEDRNSSTQKRSRSKSSASTDFAMVGSSKPSGSNYSIVVAQHTASIACNNKEENSRMANGTPPRSSNSMDVTSSDKSFKGSRIMSSNVNQSKSSQSHTSTETSLQPVSKPISNYSIISLLGHNNSTNNSERNEINTEEKPNNENRRSPRSPMSYNHQILSSNRSTFVPKKKSPTNSGSALVNSPTNYRSTRSPDINSPSPGLQQNSHHNRYHPASLSSPTSSFHPYLSSSRASPLSSGTLSPTDLYRHRSYRTTASPSTMSNSSVSGLTHQYASLNGSPTAFANRYSPSTYSGSTKTSPTQSSQTSSLSSAYNVSNLLPQTYDVNASNVSENQRYSPNPKHRSSDWSPARNSAVSGRSSPSNYANSNNSLSTTTIPKKTASIRQKYGSLSPNGFACGTNSENALSTKLESNSVKKSMSESIVDAKPLAKRSKSPTEPPKKPQAQEIYEKDLQARYNAEIAAMHHQSLIASALQQQAASSPFYHMYAGNNLHGANIPPSMSAAAAAAYMNPLYYHHPASELFRKSHPSAAMDLLHKNLVPSWMDPYNASSMMHYPQMPGSALISDKSPLAAAKNQNEVHSMVMSPYSLGRTVSARDQHSTDIDMWNATDGKKTRPTSPATSAFRRQSQQFSDCEPISLIKDEPSSDVPLNLSKH